MESKLIDNSQTEIQNIEDINKKRKRQTSTDIEIPSKINNISIENEGDCIEHNTEEGNIPKTKFISKKSKNSEQRKKNNKKITKKIIQEPSITKPSKRKREVHSSSGEGYHSSDFDNEKSESDETDSELERFIENDESDDSLQESDDSYKDEFNSSSDLTTDSSTSSDSQSSERETDKEIEQPIINIQEKVRGKRISKPVDRFLPDIKILLSDVPKAEYEAALYSSFDEETEMEEKKNRSRKEKNPRKKPIKIESKSKSKEKKKEIKIQIEETKKIESPIEEKKKKKEKKIKDQPKDQSKEGKKKKVKTQLKENEKREIKSQPKEIDSPSKIKKEKKKPKKPITPILGLKNSEKGITISQVRANIDKIRADSVLKTRTKLKSLTPTPKTLKKKPQIKRSFSNINQIIERNVPLDKKPAIVDVIQKKSINSPISTLLPFHPISDPKKNTSKSEPRKQRSILDFLEVHNDQKKPDNLII